MLQVPTKADRRYLKLLRSGHRVPEIAKVCHVTPKTVYNGLERARLAETPIAVSIPRPPRSELLCPIPPLVPSSACPHYGPIERGSVFVCAVCHQSGLDNHPALRRDSRTDPKPERRKCWTKKGALKGGVA